MSDTADLHFRMDELDRWLSEFRNLFPGIGREEGTAIATDAAARLLQLERRVIAIPEPQMMAAVALAQLKAAIDRDAKAHGALLEAIQELTRALRERRL